MRDAFDLGGLREHVEGCDRDNGEARLQIRDVAPQRRWIARAVVMFCKSILTGWRE